jgi:hypothetical protein
LQVKSASARQRIGEEVKETNLGGLSLLFSSFRLSELSLQIA